MKKLETLINHLHGTVELNSLVVHYGIIFIIPYISAFSMNDFFSYIYTSDMLFFIQQI